MDRENNYRDIVYLAALLHDIGKFYQRADSEGVKGSKELSDGIKKLENIYCPVTKGGTYSHKHVLWTAQFIEKIEPLLGNLNIEPERQQIPLKELSASHHRQPGDNVYASIIQKADHYSSGIDRTSTEGMTDAKDEGRWDDFKKKRMKSIFEGLWNESGNYDYQLPVFPASLKEEVFPSKIFNKGPDYKSQWDGFMSECIALKGCSFKVFVESLHHLLFKYTTSIPASTMHLADVSLYDHLRSTAAFAVSLYDYLDDKNRLDKFDITNGENPFLLVGADLSGIQNFIYDIVSKSAAKNLKGRSFYLQMLIDSILNRFLDDLDLFHGNVVYSSGGGFYLIAANTENNINKIDELREEIAVKVFDSHKTGLFVAIDKEAFGEEHLFEKRINEPWTELSHKLNKRKRQRYSSKLVADYNDFFEPSETGGEQQRDAITGEELTPGEKVFNIGDQQDEILVGKGTYEQIELGKELRQANHWLVARGRAGKHSHDPCNLGISHTLIKDEISIDKLISTKNGTRKTLYHINDFGNQGKCEKGISFGYRLYGGNKYPETRDEQSNVPKTFDEFAGEGSLKRIGYLRMDVDNLGRSFIKGFSEERKTFSRYSALSRNLDWFFKGYINTIWEKKKYREDTFIIYSGGDDLFAVGKWDVLVDFAVEIREAFRQFTCFNQKLSISGGIAITTPKFPVMKGAAEAGEAEQLAKSHEYKKEGIKKNSFTLFGYPLHWDNELKPVKEVSEQLIELIERGSLPHGILSRIYNYHDQYVMEKEKGKNPRWRWMIAYDFARMQKSHNSKEVRDFLNKLKVRIFIDETGEGALRSDYVYLELLYIAARWAELYLRTNKK